MDALTTECAESVVIGHMCTIQYEMLDAILTGIVVVVVVIVPFTLSSIFSNHCDNVHLLFILTCLIL